MTAETTPPSRELVDELLSADLDGEFDDACRDLGIDSAAARTMLAAVPDRRAELERARAVLAVPPVLDELLAARLRSRAVRATEPVRRAEGERRLRALRFTGAAAAVLAVCVGIFTVTGRGNDNGSDVASAPRRSVEVPRVTGTLDFGEQADAADATRTALATLSAAPGSAAAANGSPDSDPAPDRSVGVAAPEVSPGDAAAPPAGKALAGPEAAAVVADCSDAARRFAATDAGAALAAAARIDGEIATVHVFGDRRTVVVVVLDSDCLLLQRTSATLPG